MSLIHIARERTQLGQFGEDEVRDGLAAGRFLPGDLAWREGMPGWRALAEWPEFGGTPTEAPAGLPWENRATLGLLPALGQTIRDVLIQPGAAFASMRRTGGYGAPLSFYLPLAIGGSLASIGFQSLLPVQEGMPDPIAEAGGFGMLAILCFVTTPVALFIWSGLVHLALLALGAKRHPFETTLRTVAFAVGSGAVLQFIPLCGGFVGGIWGLVALCIGLGRTQECTAGKATAAVLSPFLLLCCSCGLLAFFAGGLGALFSSLQGQ